ncbi:MAG: flagellar biosynthesis protein FliQ [Vampirovibrionales bacterium]|nr:flagellar biosynthesis protein FliQ [Vampirovibrionales bacterium]
MTQTTLIDLLQQAIWLMVLLSAPILIVSLVVGVAISIFQAVTQIQESTLTFVPKILASFLVFVLTAPWLVETMTTYTARLLASLMTYAH